MSIAWIACLAAAPVAGQSPDAKADSVARKIVEAAGGQQVWDATAFVRFDYRLYRDRNLVYAVQHLWDKQLGLYRMEMPGPTNEPYVAIFYTDDFAGKVYWNGSELIQKDAEMLMGRARLRYFQDLFYVIAPFVLFDAGVTRTYVDELSTETEVVIEVTIPQWENLPTNTFYFYSDRITGRLLKTAYPLPSGEMRTYEWYDYQEYATTEGRLVLATRKRSLGQPFLIETANFAFPRLIASSVFVSADPILQKRPQDEEPQEAEPQ